ncbi:aluminum-activated malate transporter 2-like [Arachis stenosperma]|uniref:aluminum-activated malate transporter 2-like n=1 Tax=Arachis stenosperma TaxID=217475 RepID=UPI0025AB79B1|nr:aluminum-activated malate transporter 2-like [Arachis stenosperma]
MVLIVVYQLFLLIVRYIQERMFQAEQEQQTAIEAGVTDPLHVSAESIWIETVGEKRKSKVFGMGEVRDSSMMQPRVDGPRLPALMFWILANESQYSIGKLNNMPLNIESLKTATKGRKESVLMFLLSRKITASPTTEAEVLVKWKNSLLYTPFLNSWSLSNIHKLCSSWDAVVCDKTTNTTVSEIYLSGFDLSGTLHGLDFASLPNLTHLDLNDNSFIGNNFSGTVPYEIGHLRELEYLSFYNNSFNGAIPNQVISLPKLKKPGEDDPRRLIHSFKVALSITLVSAFYYVKPLYDAFDSNPMWIIITVILVSEFSVGATLAKCFNRGLATVLASPLGLGCYHLVNSIMGGHIVEPLLLGTLIFIIVAGVTYMRFLSQVKARYDYGFLVFILTFCMVSVPSYRDEDLLDTVKKRVITIFAGVLISVLVCIFVYPIWAGDDLHKLLSKNLQKLGDSIEGFGDEYFGTSDGEESNKAKLQAYKSVLNSKQIEESLVNFARWEPCHGPFRYGHPWKQYLKIGSLLRQCAYLIDSLIGFLDYTKTPSETKKKVEEACIQISKETGKGLKELSVSIQKKISPSYAANPSIEKSKIVAMNLKSVLKSGLWEGTNLFEDIPLMIVTYLLFDVVSCTEKLAESIHELSIQGKFKKKDNKVAPNCPPHLDEPCHGDQENNIGVHHVITIN